MPIKVDVPDILTRKAAGHSLRRIERETGVPRRTIERAITRAHAADVPHVVPIAPPKRKQGPYCWTLESIRAARDEQLRGVFDLPVRLAEATRTDDAIFTAYQARVATQSAIALGWQDVDSDAGRKAGELARKTILLPQQTRESILGTMAYHGLAIGYMRHEVVDHGDAMGPAVAMTLTEWPLEHVRFSLSLDALETRTANMGTVRIVHGDGRWVVFRKFGLAPWTQDAALLPLALLWAAHAEALRDWAGASYAHGQPKILGQLPEGVKLTKEGALTPEADAYLQMLASMVSGDSGAGIAPAGSKTDYLSNGSTAWQVFKELADNRESAAARIFLGTDAILGSRGGAPGVDVAEMFGIATTRIQGDLDALERGFREGAIEPWARMHGIPLADAGWARYELPDIDADKRGEQEAAALARLNESVKAMKEAGLEVTQAVVNTLRENLGVSVPCNLAAAETKSVPLPLAPTDVARVVKVREARASQGLPPVGDERDEKFIAELEAQGGAPPALPGAPPTPFTRTVETRAVPEDADGDGKINEAEAEALKKPGPRDGDGDGDVDEEDERIAESRKRVAKALETHDKRRAQRDALRAEATAAQAKVAEFSRERQDGGTLFIEGRVPDAENAVDAAKENRAKERARLRVAENTLSDFEGVSDDELAQPNWEDDDGNPITGHEAKARATAEVADATAAATAADQGYAKAKDDLKAVKKEQRAAERAAEKATTKAEDFDDGRDDLESALADYRDTHETVASEREAEAGGADKARAAADEAAKLVDEGYGDDDEANAQKTREKAAIVTGPKGGKYYVAPSGEKVYVKTLHTRARPIDRDGDGKINEAEKAEAALGVAVIPDDPEIDRARKHVQDALDEYDRNTPKREAKKRKLRAKQKKAADRIEAANKKTRDLADSGQDDTEAYEAARAEEINALDDFEGLREEIREIDTDGAQPISEALDDYGLTVKGVAERSGDPKAVAAANEIAGLADSVIGDPKPAEDVARAVVTGPKGGRYYVAPSGEKVYVK